MKKFILLVFFVLSLTACSTGLINVDGQVDEVEQSVINLAVGTVLTAYPQAVAPAYAVSTALISQMDGNSVLLSAFDSVIRNQVDSLDLLDSERASALEIYAAIRAKTAAELEANGITDTDNKLIVVSAVIEAVKTASASRLVVATE